MSQVDITRRGAALWARITRPESGNACGSQVMAGLEEWLAAASDPQVRVLVLTGSGSSFCAGADVKEAAGLLEDPDALTAFLGRGRDLVRSVRRAPVPTIAAVNGVAYAGGLELSLACDLAVAASSARMGDRHIAAGQVPGWGSSAMLPRTVGPRAARGLLLTGSTWSAEEALAHDLVNEVVPDDRLEERVGEIAERLAVTDPGAMDRMLRLTRTPDDEDDQAWTREWTVLMEHVESPATRSATQDFGGRD